MRTPYKTTLVVLLCLLGLNAYSQKTTPILINSVLLDTVEVKEVSTVTHMLWLNDTITVGILKDPIEIDTAKLLKMKKAFKDDSPITAEEIETLKASFRKGAQNCYSYALERYFANNENFSQNLFSKTVGLERPSAEAILENYFTTIESFPTDSKQDLKRQPPNDVLVGFVNKDGWTTHLVYYDASVFYTKNGFFKPSEFKSLKKFLKKSYIYTEQIVLYKIDEEKVKNSIPELLN